jgi:hypothetical protein
MKRQASLLVLALTTACLALFLLAWQSLVVAPRATSGSFETERAYSTLQRVLAEEVPHPTGSVENRRVRDRILAELTSAGYAPEVQKAFQCSPPDKVPGCTEVENILAILKGSGDGQAILATAHYDSVPAGPGVGDDGVGVAVMLELARALKTAPIARNDVIFLLTDGEETGLRGSLAFAERDPRMKHVGLVVNVEARGNTGPAIMFETGSGNRRLLSLFSSAVRAPVSNSLAYEIYRLLPNDTDFSTYRRKGLSGFNFAMIGSAARYHTPQDNLALLDRNTLAHHGEQVSALIRALQSEDLAALRSDRDASYVDLFGLTLFVWPASLNLPLALAAFLAVLGLFWRSREEPTGRSVLGALGALLLLPVLLFALGWLLSFPLGRWPEVHPLDHPAPWPARIALVAATLALSIAFARLLAPRIPARTLSLTAWLLLSAFGVATAATLPGAAYAFLWPALLFTLLAYVANALFRTDALSAASFAGFLAIAMFWTGHMLALDAVVGFPASQFKLLALLPMAWATLPLFASVSPIPKAVVAAPAVATVAAAAMAASVTGYRVDHPRPLNLVYYEDAGSGEASWLVQDTPIDRSFMRQAGFPESASPFNLAGVFPTSGFQMPAMRADLPAPRLEVLRREALGDRIRVTGRISSARAGFVFGFLIPAGSGITSVSAEGEPLLLAERLSSGQPVWARIFGTGDRPLSLTIEHRNDARPRFALFERSALPDTPEAHRLVSLRPKTASPVHAGDGAFVFRTIDLQALAFVSP